jgi:two-component system, cell cycle sensor histidine kinase DivJ
MAHRTRPLVERLASSGNTGVTVASEQIENGTAKPKAISFGVFWPVASAVAAAAFTGATLTGQAGSVAGLASAGFAVAAALGWARNLRLATEQRQSSAARNEFLLSGISDLIVWFDADGSVIKAAGGANGEAGFDLTSLTGQGLFDRILVGDRPVFRKAISDLVHFGSPINTAFRVRTDDGTYRWLDMRAEPDAGRGPMVAVLRDDTIRREIDAARARAQAEAEQASAAKARFLATVSHELRTPLNAIIGFSQMLGHETLAPISADQRKEYAGIIQSSGEHLLEIVNTLLDVSKIESGAMTIEPDPLDVVRLCGSCIDLIKMRAAEKGVQLSSAFPSSLPELVADSRALKQVVINLLSNALKFTPAGGEVTLTAVRDGAMIEIAVADTGIGIAETELPRIGNPFFQAKSSYDRDYEGTGLGLSVVRGLVGLHGGDMVIESAQGHGTRIAVRLPVAGATGARDGARIVTFARSPQKILANAEPVRLTA